MTPMFKKISLFVFGVALAGLFCELFALVPLTIPKGAPMEVLLFVRRLLSTVYLDVSWNLSYFNPESNLVLQFPNAVAYLLMLSGAMLFHTSQGREMRLLRFGLALLMISSVAGILWHLVWPFMYGAWRGVGGGVMRAVGAVLILARDCGLIYISWLMLRSLNEAKVLETKQETVHGHVLVTVVEAPRWKRFANMFLDNIIMFMAFFSFARLIPLFGQLEENIGEQMTMVVFLLMARLIYYPVFEILLQATPGKYLTETRVTTITGKRPTPDAIWSRTFSRLIPFEAFSFLSSAPGWHDKLSNTTVASEVRTGVRGVHYLLWISIVLVVGCALLIYFLSPYFF